ncbi:MAG: MBL fold metallo-hydrolase [Chloroflexota bacterium]
MAYAFSQLKPNVYHIADPLGVFMTLVVGEEKALLLDTGYGLDNLPETVAQIADLPVILVNSHGHLDHVLGNRFFDEAYLHPADWQLYQQHTTQERKTGHRQHAKRSAGTFSGRFFACGLPGGIQNKNANRC